MAFDFSSLPFGDIFRGGLSFLGAQQGSDAARKAAQQATPIPFGVSGPFGGLFVNPQTRQLQLSAADNPFGTLFNALGASSLANAATAPGSFLYGANPEVAAAYQGLFGQGLTDEIQGQLDLLRSAAAPEESRARLGLDNTLFARGQLGTTGGAERFRALEEAIGQADLQRQIQAQQLGRQTALDRFQGALSSVGQGMAGQLQNFNIGTGAFGGMQGLFQNLIQQAGLGLGAMSGTPVAAALNQAAASQNPFTAGFNFLNQSGLFDWLNNRGGPQFNPNSPELTQPITTTLGL